MLSLCTHNAPSLCIKSSPSDIAALKWSEKTRGNSVGRLVLLNIYTRRMHLEGSSLNEILEEGNLRTVALLFDVWDGLLLNPF